MAYMSQENKKEKLAALKKIIPKSWKWSLSVKHHSTLVLNIYSAPVDLIEEINRCNKANQRNGFDPPVERTYAQVNEYYIDRQFDKTLPLIKKIRDAMMVGNHNNSDSMTDYFDVGWYIDINIGKWDRPFICTNINAESINEKIARLEKENQTLRAMHPQMGIDPPKPLLSVVKPKFDPDLEPIILED